MIGSFRALVAFAFLCIVVVLVVLRYIPVWLHRIPCTSMCVCKRLPSHSYIYDVHMCFAVYVTDEPTFNEFILSRHEAQPNENLHNGDVSLLGIWYRNRFLISCYIFDS